MSDPDHIDPTQLRSGPIRHESLPPEVLDLIRSVFEQIGRYLGITLKEFQTLFTRDMHPESEVALWCRIAKGWLAYHEDFLENRRLPDEEERKLVGALIAISTGIVDVSKLGVPVEVGRKLLRCYDDSAEH